MAKLKTRWMEVVKQTVPLWIQGISTYIPPKPYVVFMWGILNNIPTKAYSDKIMQSKLPDWRKRFTLFTCLYFAQCLGWITLKWMLAIRKFIRCFGIRTKIDQSPLHEQHMRMRIWYWFREIEYYEVKV